LIDVARFFGDNILLKRYAEGDLPFPQHLVMQSHMSLSPETSKKVNFFETKAAQTLDKIPPIPPTDRCWERVLGQIRHVPTSSIKSPQTTNAIPDCVHAWLKNPWQPVTNRIRQQSLIKQDGQHCYLLEARAGTRLPMHTHEGEEWVLLLTGSLSEDGQTYRRGDLVVADSSISHAPLVGDSEDCLCLVATTAPVRVMGWRGVVSRLLLKDSL
jgi:putative transcriptional regulator